MTRRNVIRHAESSDDMEAVRQLCWDYRDFLLSYGEEQRRITETFYQRDAYAALMDNLIEKHARPLGAILLVGDNNGAVQGCGMIRDLGGGNAEIKRVFIRPEARGAGAGRDLTRALIAQAHADGIPCCCWIHRAPSRPRARCTRHMDLLNAAHIAPSLNT